MDDNSPGHVVTGETPIRMPRLRVDRKDRLCYLSNAGPTQSYHLRLKKTPGYMFLIPEEQKHSTTYALFDVHSRRRWTYSELTGAIAEISRKFASRRKSLFFLFGRNDAASIIAYLSIIEAGHVLALLDDELAPEFKHRLIDLYQPDFVISSLPTINLGIERLEERYSATSIDNPALYIWSSDVRRADVIYPPTALLLSVSRDVATSQFARLTASNLESNARSLRTALGITEAERAITSLPMHFYDGLSVINSHLLAGAEIIVSNAGWTSPAFWNTVGEQECTSLAVDPDFDGVQQVLELNLGNAPSLRTVTLTTRKLNTAMIANLQKIVTQHGGQLFVMYGQPEATAQITILPPQKISEKLGSVGQPLENGTFSVKTDIGFTHDRGITGEILYLGPNVMIGYANHRDDLSRGNELNGVLHTGEIGYLDADSYLFLTNRDKHRT